MERRRLTKEDIERAEVYIPLAKKYAIAQVLAPGCIEKAEGTPPLWQENILGRRLVECYILTGYYLHITDVSGLDGEVPLFQFTLEDYDRLSWAAHELAGFGEDKSGDILRDFDELMGILSRQVDNLLSRKNDVLARFGELAAAGVTPEAVRQLQEALEEAGRAEA